MSVTGSDLGGEKEVRKTDITHLLVQVPHLLRNRIQLLRAGRGRHRARYRFCYHLALDTVRRPVKSVRLNIQRRPYRLPPGRCHCTRALTLLLLFLLPFLILPLSLITRRWRRPRRSTRHLSSSRLSMPILRDPVGRHTSRWVWTTIVTPRQCRTPTHRATSSGYPWCPTLVFAFENCWRGKSTCTRGAIGTRRLGSYGLGGERSSEDARGGLWRWRNGLSKRRRLVNRGRAPAGLVKFLNGLDVHEWTARVPDLDPVVDT